MNSLQIPYQNFQNLEKYYSDRFIGKYERRYFNFSAFAHQHRKFADWLWDQWGARFVQIHGRRYLEFCTQEQLIMFLLKWR